MERRGRNEGRTKQNFIAKTFFFKGELARATILSTRSLFTLSQRYVVIWENEWGALDTAKCAAIHRTALTQRIILHKA